MSERTMILRSQPITRISTMQQHWTGKLFGWLGSKFDEIASKVSKWSNF